MRKQDRIAAEQQARASQHADDRSQPRPEQREQIKNRDESEQRGTPQRQPGRLPLPD